MKGEPRELFNVLGFITQTIQNKERKPALKKSTFTFSGNVAIVT